MVPLMPVMPVAPVMAVALPPVALPGRRELQELPSQR